MAHSHVLLVLAAFEIQLSLFSTILHENMVQFFYMSYSCSYRVRIYKLFEEKWWCDARMMKFVLVGVEK